MNSNSDDSRYKGKPFLRLLDCYILDAIDQLDDQQRNALTSMQPKLTDVYGVSGSWQHIVRSQMDFDEAFDNQVREFWEGYLDHKKSLVETVSPNEFVISFVAQNFPNIVAS